MLGFDDMFAPRNGSLRMAIRETQQNIAKIGAANAPFKFVRVGRQRVVEATPEVKAAIARRGANVLEEV